MNKYIPYKPFNTFIFRTPHISLNEFSNNLEKLNDEDNYWYIFLKDKILQEAIFLATPVLYSEIQKFLSGALTTPKEVYKLKMSVLRYYTRMSTRCTPFGLFAGFSLGEFIDGNSSIELIPSHKYNRNTRLDMNYLCNLAQDIGKQDTIRQYLLYYPNNSIYQLGEKLRYIEYYYKDTKRIHNISSVDNTEYLENILQKASSGAKIDDLALLLVDEEITFEDAIEFIHELINSQLLVSELEPEVTGEDFLFRLFKILQTIPENTSLKEDIKELMAIISNIDKAKIGETLPLFEQLEKLVKKIKTPYDIKFLLQTDMYKPVVKAALDIKVINEIEEAFELMNKLTISPTETLISKFVENYYERYEDQEMPLLQVLDIENGIGYQASIGDFSSLLRGYIFPLQQNSNIQITWNNIQSVLHKKFLEAYKINSYSVEIEEKDFDFLKAGWNDLPTTVSSICKIFLDEENNQLVYVNGLIGSSAANLLGRFSHVTKELENYVKEITSYEQQLNPDAIYAEIVHLPESRIGNILLRPILRPYEIPYLSKSSVKEECQFPLSDLYISVKRGKIFLRSKRLNKEVIPRMSTAHNFTFNSMPVYHFLCDMQTQGTRVGIGFNWGALAREYEFLPRLKYKNIILSLAKWVIKTTEFKKIIGLEVENKKHKEDMSQILSTKAKLTDFRNWRMEKQLPRYLVLPDGDNELFIDMNNSLSIQTLYSIIKKRPSFQLEEFPFDKNNAIIRNEKGECYTNEFIFGFYKENS